MALECTPKGCKTVGKEALRDETGKDFGQRVEPSREGAKGPAMKTLPSGKKMAGGAGIANGRP